MTMSLTDLGASEVLPPAEPRRRRRGARVLSAVVVVLLVLEVVARLLEPRLSPAARWNNAVPGDHLENIEGLSADGGVDVLVVGSSSGGSGIDPQQLADEALAPRGAYNLWMNGPSVQSIELITSRFAMPALSPRVLVVAVSSRELNDEGETQRDHVEILRASSAGRTVLTDDHPVARLERAIIRASALVRTRQELRQPHRVLDAVRGRREPSTIGPRGMETERIDQTLEILPAHVKQEREALRPFEVGGAELEALAALVDAAQARGVRVVLVDMPVLEEVYVPYHERGVDDDRRYQAVLASFAEAQDIELVQARALDWEDDLFADENHLNGEGARRLTSLVSDAIGR